MGNGIFRGSCFNRRPGEGRGKGAGYSDYGNVGVFLEGKRRSSFQGYSEQVQLQRVELEPLSLRQGHHPMQLVGEGRDRRSGNFFVGVERIELWPQ